MRPHGLQRARGRALLAARPRTALATDGPGRARRQQYAGREMLPPARARTAGDEPAEEGRGGLRRSGTGCRKAQEMPQSGLQRKARRCGGEPCSSLYAATLVPGRLCCPAEGDEEGRSRQTTFPSRPWAGGRRGSPQERWAPGETPLLNAKPPKKSRGGGGPPTPRARERTSLRSLPACHGRAALGPTPCQQRSEAAGSGPRG
ncbi:unnamed protein product [Prorocentrum cordatum]|uniref:Uncharacterized protein n=1 Tax=Prorocentrum cordatum TaxID=2364126 RepID=A0ABN9STZ2_9DINO|nr:unnamed protein product [Polarella glacialis]